MFPILLALHSLFRWLVLISLLYATFRAYAGWLQAKPFRRSDGTIRQISVRVAHIQFLIGLWLYFISPLVNYFLHHAKDAVHVRDLRFFGMEHVTMMVISIALITMGAEKSKRKPTDKGKFKTMALWFTIALLIIFLSIPWPFSPFTTRPFFRPF